MRISKTWFSILNPGKPPYRVLYFGTDYFAVVPLRKLLQNLRTSKARIIEHIEVVCPPERRRVINKKIVQGGDQLTVREFAQEQELPVHYWHGKQGWSDNYSVGGPYDIGIVASFGYLITNQVLDLCLCGALNIHPSLLPEWRGAAPMTYAMLSGAKHTGVSIVGVSRNRFDHGKIYLQEKFKIPDNVTYDDFSTSLAVKGTEMLFDVLSNFDQATKNAKPQSNIGVSHAPKVIKEKGYIDWNEHTWHYIWRRWRAFSTRVGVHTSWQGKRVRLVAMTSEKLENNVAGTLGALPGQPMFDKDRDVLFIKCKDDWVGITKLQVECKSVITAKDFSNSYLQSHKCSKNVLFESLVQPS